MKSLWKKMTLLCISFIAISNLDAQQSDTLVIGPGDVNTKLLKKGTYQWINYNTSAKDKIKRNLVYWTLSVEPATFDGKTAISMKQLIEFKDTVYESSLAVCDEKTLAPYFHSSETAGRKMVFDFIKKTVGINGKMLSKEDTARRVRMTLNGLDSATTRFTLNYHFDLAVFPLLPYKKNRTFLVNLYDPGSPAVTRVAYTVAGEAKLKSIENSEIDCWLLTYTSQYSKQTFWISKKTKEVMMLEEEFNGIIRHKVRIGFDKN